MRDMKETARVIDKDIGEPKRMDIIQWNDEEMQGKVS
jgi:hypothetical protein